MSPTPEPLTLADETTRLQVLGGSHLTITSLTHEGRERLMSPDNLPEKWRIHGVRAGITLLHPWANRVKGLPWDELDDLPRDPNGIAIHGRPGAWEIEPSGPNRVSAETSAEPTEAFPYDHTIAAVIELGPGSVTVDTTLTATGTDAVPAVFGWHPYFDIPDDGRRTLAMPARAHLVLDELQLPTGTANAEHAETLTLGETTLDEAYAEIAQGATWTASDGSNSVSVRFDHGYPAAQVFAPLGSPSVSLEPMAAPTNALAGGTNLPVATPGNPYRARFTVLLGA